MHTYTHSHMHTHTHIHTHSHTHTLLHAYHGEQGVQRGETEDEEACQRECQSSPRYDDVIPPRTAATISVRRLRPISPSLSPSLSWPRCGLTPSKAVAPWPGPYIDTHTRTHTLSLCVSLSLSSSPSWPRCGLTPSEAVAQALSGQAQEGRGNKGAHVRHRCERAGRIGRVLGPE
jgi:hypothetical protein